MPASFTRSALRSTRIMSAKINPGAEKLKIVFAPAKQCLRFRKGNFVKPDLHSRHQLGRDREVDRAEHWASFG